MAWIQRVMPFFKQVWIPAKDMDPDFHRDDDRTCGEPRSVEANALDGPTERSAPWEIWKLSLVNLTPTLSLKRRGGGLSHLLGKEKEGI
jgi:hypothetical protein